MNYFKRNNFDLIRLVAASQVMIFHGLHHLDLNYPIVKTMVGYFPGVPAFFFISGLLISASWERKPELGSYGLNRFLRLYPAFLGVLIFSLLALIALYEPAVEYKNIGVMSFWFLTQIFMLPWTPAVLEGYGTGSVNGSLWTIPVEATFYVAVPVIYWLARKFGSMTIILTVIVVVSFLCQYVVFSVDPENQTQALMLKLIRATAVPWIGMFCFGILAQRNIERIYPLIAGRALVYAALYIALAVLASNFPLYPLLKGNSNSMGILNYLAMCALILSAAYSMRGISDDLLRRNDISYGIYIYHIPVINILVASGVSGELGFVFAVIASIVIAGLSWFIIEKPALGLKRWTIYSHESGVKPLPSIRDSRE